MVCQPRPFTVRDVLVVAAGRRAAGETAASRARALSVAPRQWAFCRAPARPSPGSTWIGRLDLATDVAKLADTTVRRVAQWPWRTDRHWTDPTRWIVPCHSRAG